MDQILWDINDHDELQKVLYETEADFLEEDVTYRSACSKTVQSNLIKTYLHEILTNAIFNYLHAKN